MAGPGVGVSRQGLAPECMGGADIQRGAIPEPLVLVEPVGGLAFCFPLLPGARPIPRGQEKYLQKMGGITGPA
ncbi:unnamed protein product [Gadus morhua 'NCC']